MLWFRFCLNKDLKKKTFWGGGSTCGLPGRLHIKGIVKTRVTVWWVSLTDLVLTSAPAFTTRAAISSLPCLAAQCRAVCTKQRQRNSKTPVQHRRPSLITTLANCCSIIIRRLCPVTGHWLVLTGRGLRASCARRGVRGWRGGQRDGFPPSNEA